MYMGESNKKSFFYISKYKIKKYIFYLVVLGGLSRGLSVFGFDPLTKFGEVLDIYFGRRMYFLNIINILIALGALHLHGIIKELYLPFLSETIFPEKLIPKRKPVIRKDSEKISLEVDVPANSKVIYWAAKDKPNSYVSAAYDDYSNSGVIYANSKGKALLEFNKGSGYYKQQKRYRPKHVHYRYVMPNRAFMSKLYTKYY